MQRRSIPKNWIRGALAVLLVADLALAWTNWQFAQTPHAGKGEVRRLELQVKLMSSDVRTAKAIQQQLPQVRQQCDDFFNKQLREASVGYSAIVADLGQLAKTAGLRAGGLSFRQKEISDRGVVQIEVAAVVEGDYPSLVRFLNGLERSQNFYLLDNLSLTSSDQGALKLNLQLRTYFRS